MALVLRMAYEGLLRFDAEHKDVRTDDLLLAGSPLKIIGITSFYLLFVLKLGPALMRNREPFELKYVLLTYNAAQVLINAYCVYAGIYPFFNYKTYQDRGCMMGDFSGSPESLNILRLVHLYYLIKVSDYLDTVFFVLRKRDSQVTFLHIYHHTMMGMGIYTGVRYYAGGHPIVLGYVNTMVHTVMYTYYFITALRPGIKHSIWWKKHITQLQILQFLLLTVHFIRPLLHKDCKLSKIIMVFLIVQAIFLTLMFSEFYIKTYVWKPKENCKKSNS